MKVEIKNSDRVFVCGRTGSGKSVLVKSLIIPRLVNYVMYDYKHEIELPGAEVFYSPDDFRKKSPLSQGGRPA